MLLLLSRFRHIQLCVGSPSGSPIPGILQARTLEWVAISFSNACMHAKLLQPCPTLCDPMDSSPPGSSVHRILQARILEWVAISFSKKCLWLYLNICATTLKYFILGKSLKRIYFFRNLKVWQLNSIAQVLSLERTAWVLILTLLCANRVHLRNLFSCSI